MNGSAIPNISKKQYLRIAMAGGGTGGHVYPGLAVLQRLHQIVQVEQPETVLEVLWIGQKGGMEQNIVAQYPQSTLLQVQYHGISCGKLRRYFSWKNLGDVFQIVLGIWQSYWLLQRKQPCLLFSKGGFVTIPSLVAAKLLRIPSLAHESDLDPGLATRLALPLVETLFLPYKQSRKFYKDKYQGKLDVCGNPVRSEFFAETTAISLQTLLPLSWFGPDNNLKRPLLLVLGGSLGATEINNYILSWFERAMECLEQLYIFHQCGTADYKKFIAIQQQFANYRVEPFVFEELPALFQQCRCSTGLVLSRAGAGALWEILASGNRAIVVPLQVGSRGDQLRNAEFFVEQGWADSFIADTTDQDVGIQRNSQKLLEQVRAILHDSSLHGKSVVALRQPTTDAAQYIAHSIWWRMLTTQA